MVPDASRHIRHSNGLLRSLIHYFRSLNSLSGIAWTGITSLESGFFLLLINARRNSRPIAVSSRCVSIHDDFVVIGRKSDEKREKFRSSSPGSLCRPECHSSSGRISRLWKRYGSNLLVRRERHLHYEYVLREDHCNSVGRLPSGTERD